MYLAAGKTPVGKKSKKQKGQNNAQPKTKSSKTRKNNLILNGSPAASKNEQKKARGSIRSSSQPSETFETPSAKFSTSPMLSTDDDRTKRRRRTTATIGTLQNLVVMIRFRDHINRVLPTPGDIDVLMNNEEIDDILAPTGSLKMIYWENSYGQLTIESKVLDWIDVPETEAYYADGNSGVDRFRRRFHVALKEALDKLEQDGFNFRDFDADNDGHIDR